MVMRLENAEEIQREGKILHQCKTPVEAIAAKSAMTLRFSGRGHFGHQFLYAKPDVKETNFLESVEETCAKYLQQKESLRLILEYTPHLSIMKIDEKKFKRNGVWEIPEESYARQINVKFGEEPVTALHSCKMEEPKDEDGFYGCVATVTFGDSDEKSSS